MSTQWLNIEPVVSTQNPVPFCFAPPEKARPRGKPNKSFTDGGPPEGEDLPYRVEVWNADKTAIEHVVAVTASASIGQAAFYAAAREFVERYVTLRHKQAVINRWNAPPH